uniref:Serpentine receptor class gamma n=1 Tax=Strongyloides venezuelensis TaxID=75913 RepID=A0A0K0FQW5_STRVS
MFLITLLTSVNRYIAVKYPLLYEHYFSKSKTIVILLTFIILSTIVGLGNIFFNPEFIELDVFDHFVPYFKSKNVIYYQLFYQILLFGIISISTCTFNVMAILTLKKHNKTGNKYKKELYYIIYSIFIFITLFIVEAYFICKFISLKNKFKLFANISYFLHIVAFDLTTLGDFYFLIYSSSELRKALKTSFGCSEKIKNKVNIKIPYRK